MAQKISIQHPNGLAGAKADARAAINAAVGRARERYITVISGQAETYAAKYADALAGTDGPWVQATARARGISAQEARDLVLSTRDKWEQTGVAIEEIRETGLSSVASATDEAAILEIVKAVRANLEVP
jgi:hypothetical protein